MSNQSLIKSTALKDVVQKDEVKNRLKEIMGTRAPQFAAALVQIVNQSWQLQKCDPNSVIGAALTAAALDLSIDPNLGEATSSPMATKPRSKSATSDSPNSPCGQANTRTLAGQ